MVKLRKRCLLSKFIRDLSLSCEIYKKVLSFSVIITKGFINPKWPQMTKIIVQNGPKLSNRCEIVINTRCYGAQTAFYCSLLLTFSRLLENHHVRLNYSFAFFYQIVGKFSLGYTYFQNSSIVIVQN